MIGEVNAANQARDGRARPLATTSALRGKILPDIPTFAEYQLGLTMDNWYALAAPAGTPPHIIETLHQHVADALQQKALEDSFASIGLSPWKRDSSSLADYFMHEIEQYREQIRHSGARQAGR